LQPEQNEQRDDTHAGEHEDGDRVCDPRHLSGRIDADDTVDGAFDRKEDAVHERALPREHLVEERADRLGDSYHQHDEHNDLDKVDEWHQPNPLQTFWVDESPDQVEENADCDDADYDVESAHLPDTILSARNA